MSTADLFLALVAASTKLAEADAYLAKLEAAENDQDARALALHDAHTAAMEALHDQGFRDAVDGTSLADPQIERAAFYEYELAIVTLQRLRDAVIAQERLVARENDDNGYPRGALYLAWHNARRDVARVVEPGRYEGVIAIVKALASQLRELHEVTFAAEGQPLKVANEIKKILYAAGIHAELFIPSTIGGGSHTFAATEAQLRSLLATDQPKDVVAA